MHKIWKRVWKTTFLYVLSLFAYECPLAASRFSKVTSLKAPTMHAKLRVSWHKVSGAKKCRVRIYVDGTLLTKTTTTSRKQSFEGSLFTAGQIAKNKSSGIADFKTQSI